MNTRKTVFYCNLAIIVLCILSIVSYFFLPFWKIEVDYTLTAETIQELFVDDEATDDGESPLDNPEGLINDVDFTQILGEDGISLSVSLTLQTTDILSSLSKEPTEVVEKLLNENVHNLINQISGTLSQVVKVAVKTLVQTALKEGIKVELQGELGGLTEEQQAELNNAGLTDEYLSNQAAQLVDSIYEEGATAETVADSALNIIEDAMGKMQSTGNPDYADLVLSEENKAELREQLTEVFKTFETEDGTLNLENFTTDFILDMLAEESEESEESSETAAILATPLSAKPSSETAEEDEKVAQLREILTEKIMEALEGTEETIVSVVKIISYVILATFAIWAFPILKILLKLKRRNNSIKLGLPIWFGSIPYVVLCLIPTLALSLLNNPPAQLADMIGEVDVLSGLNITFTSCSMVSFIVGIVLAVFVLFFYAPKRRALKRNRACVQTSQPQTEPQPDPIPEVNPESNPEQPTEE